AVKARFGGNAESKKMRKSMLKQEFLEFRISEAEGLHKGYDRMQKILSQLNQLKAKPDAEEINLRTGNVIEDVLQSFVADTDPEQQLAYKDLEQIEKLDLEEMDLKWKMAMLSVRVHKFEQKAGRKIDFDKKESARFNKKKVRCYKCQQRGHFARECSESDGVIAAKEFGMIAGCDSGDALKEENTSNLLKYSERIHTDVETAKKDLQTQLDNHVSRTAKWRNSSKNLFKLIDSSMSVRTKVGLGFTNCIGENKLGWDDSAFSVFTTNSKDMEGRPIFYRFAKTNSMKVVPPPLTGDYTSLSDHTDLDESQMSYGTKSLTFCDPKCVPNGFVSCIDSDKSSEVNTNDLASSDSGLRSSMHKPTDSSYASTYSVSTSVNEAEIDSNIGTPIKEPISVQDLPSFTCNSFDKNKHSSRTSCNKNGSFNKKAGQFRKYASSVSKLCFVCGSVPTGKPKATPVPTGKPKGTPVPTGEPKATPVPTGKPKGTPVPTGKLKVKPVPTGKPKFIPVPTGRPNSSLPVATDKGCSPSGPSATEDEGIFDSRCSRSMTGNKERLDDFHEFHGGKVTFGDTECLILSKDFQLLDDSMVVLKVLSKHNLYTINLNNLCPRGNLACLVAHASFDESVKWHRFCWVFFLEHKDETYPIFKNFINLVENQLNKKVKAIRCDNSTKFKNAQMIKLCGSKGIKREYSNPRTPQQNRVSVTSPHNTTPYALLTGNIPTVSHFKPFGCHVTILNTSDHLCKFDGKADEGYIVGYSASNKAYRVYNVPNKRIEESMNLRFLENKPNVQGLGHDWYFDLNYLTDSLGYRHVSAKQPASTQRNTTNSVGIQDANSDSDYDKQVIIVPSFPSHSIQRTQPIDTPGDKVDDSPFLSADEIFQKELARLTGKEHQDTFYADSLTLGTEHNAKDLQTPPSAQPVPPGCIPVPTGNVLVPTGSLHVPTGSIPVPAAATMVPSDDVPVHSSSSTDSIFDGEHTTRFPCPSDLGNHNPSPGIFSSSSYDDEFDTALNNVASSVEVSPVATKRINTIHPQSLIIEDPTSAVQTQSKEEMQQFKFQNVWVLVDLPPGKYAIGTKWILKNKQDARGIVVRNKARLVAQGHRHEKGIDYDELFAPVTRIEAIRLFLAFASYMGFLVYQMDVKSAFLYERITKEVYVTQPKGFMDPQHPKRVYKVVKSLYGLHQALRAWTATTPYKAPKPKSKSESDSPINVHVYRSMVGSLMYLTASRPEIIFVVSACSRRQVTPTTSNLETVKKIFKYLKGQPKLGLWYPKESPLVLEAYSGSDYAGANKDMKSTTGGCQFLGRWLISWQCRSKPLWLSLQMKLSMLLLPTVVVRYALTSNPIIFDSLVKQFWSTATLRAPELGLPAILATIDKTPYTITEELVRSHLQLADDGGVADLPIPEIYSRMDNLGYVKEYKKGQNQIKIGQKREAWRSREKSEAVTVKKERKTKENAS
nr:hypothetical protein [Tanacetum cinerariifolium]